MQFAIMTDADIIRKYWEERAAGDPSAQSTTRDYYLRDIEFRVLRDEIMQRKPLRIFDIGCGDAFTTSRLAGAFPGISFVGGDYTPYMLKNAERNAKNCNVRNLTLINYDVSSPVDVGVFDFVYTTRCLINLPGWELQKAAIENISRLLSTGGTYVMIENFLDGQRELNELRGHFGLPEIGVRHHNFFLDEAQLTEFLKRDFGIEAVRNISSAYYMVTRVIYSKICQNRGTEPDYFDEHHELGSKLPFCGNFGPVKMMVLTRK
jgi:SAM-dependent methyltransferase